MIYKQIIRIAIGEKGEPLLKVIDSCNEVCLKVISTVMYFTPIGVFCTIVPVVEANGTSTIVSLATQLVILYVAFYGFAFIVYGGAVKFHGKTSPFKFFRAIMPAALNAFGTCSSSATIPISKSCVENELVFPTRFPVLQSHPLRHLLRWQDFRQVLWAFISVSIRFAIWEQPV